MHPVRPFLLLLTLCLWATSASPGLSQEAADPSGRWSGRWEDCRSGHDGPLQACLTRSDCGYRATFTGRFLKVIPFRYSVDLRVVGQGDGKTLFEGSSRVGLLFGVFSYRGAATASDFVLDYCSRRYEGRFVLGRCGANQH